MTFDRLESFGTVGSTMDIARDRAADDRAAGIAILADYQTGGRGRQGRSWFAPPGANVILTAIGEPVSASEAWKVALVAAIAAAEGIARATGAEPGLRFPNDLWLDEKKLGGILIETVPHPQARFVMPLIGIGINVNSVETDFPPELRDRATSLRRVEQREFAVGAIAGFILRRLGELWDGLADASFDDTILRPWRDRADRTARRTFYWQGAARICQVVDIEPDGMVRLEADNGDHWSIHATQVIFGDD